MNRDEARAWAFMRRGDARGTVERPFRFGTAVFTPEAPLRHDSNFLYCDRVPPDTSPNELVAEAERLFVQASLGHRALVFPDPAAGERFARAVAGWRQHRSVIMVHRRDPQTAVDPSLAVEVDEAELRPARRAARQNDPWLTPDVMDQLLAYRRVLERWLSVRYFAVRECGNVVSYTDLYQDGIDAQVEDVGTLEEFRGRGYAKAVVMRAVEEARRAGAEFVFLVADEDDWPKELYQRLGFDTVARYVKFVRPARSDA